MRGARGMKGILLGIVLAAALAAAGCDKAELPAWENAGGQERPGKEEGTAEGSWAEERLADGDQQVPGGGESPAAAGMDSGSTAGLGRDSAGAGEMSAAVAGETSAAVAGNTDSGLWASVVKLPSVGRELADFVPEGWELMDSVTLDFNEDGVLDYVGVLESHADPDLEEESCELPPGPRVLFAAASDGADRYRLDFTEENLIRTAAEGGPFGDPYEPLTAQGRSFTTHSYGGSSWKWSEAYTYTYKNSKWYLTASEETSSFGGYTTDSSINDYVTGIGIRHKRSSDAGEIERNISDINWDHLSYDLTYEVKLDPPIQLHEAGMRRFRLQSGQEEWPVASIQIAEGMNQRKTPAMLPRDQGYFPYQDGECLLYSYMDINDEIWYLALYSRKDQTLSVIVREESPIEEIHRYKDKIYYTADIRGPVSYKEYNGNVRQSQEQVGVKLTCISMDGTDAKEIFSYELPEWEGKVLEASPPFMYLSTEISGGEIVTEVSIDGRPHPFYRMNLDGSGIQRMGTVPEE